MLLELPSNDRCLQSQRLATGLHATLLPLKGYSSLIAYRLTAISSFPRAVLVKSLIGLAFLPRGSVLMVIIFQSLPQLPP
jgi:hypothetical protein